MPVTTLKVELGRIFIFTCEVCGAEARFGVGGDLRAAIAKKDAHLAGRWYCAQHCPLLTENQPPAPHDATVEPAEAPDDRRQEPRPDPVPTEPDLFG